MVSRDPARCAGLLNVAPWGLRLNLFRHALRRSGRSGSEETAIHHLPSAIARRGRTIGIIAGLCLFLASLSLSGASTSTDLAEDRGITGLLQALERLPVVASALHTTAHPDDEDNGLLVYLSRGIHARTMLLTATRGEGGQNLLGPEKAEAYGLVRTGELLASGQYYGVEQFFTRAFEFGYSKTADETLEKWGHEEILADFVRVIRQQRPDIIISRFYGTPRDRHGHHQSAGILTREAYRAAADPNRFPEQIAEGLRPWQAKKLYQDSFRFAPSPDEGANLKIDLGKLDPVLGRSYHEIGMEGLSQQRSQGMADIIPRKGSIETALRIVDQTIPVSDQESSLFDGIDTSITGIAARGGPEAAKWPELTTALGEIQQHAIAALEAFTPHDPQAPTSPILAGLSRLGELMKKIEARPLGDDAKRDLLFALRWKERDFLDAARRALNLEVTARSEDATVVPGQSFTLTVGVYNRGREPIAVRAIRLLTPNWEVTPTQTNPTQLEGYKDAQIKYNVRVAADAPYTEPYWYRPSETDNRYRLRSLEYNTLPFAPPVITAVVACRAMGVDFEITEPTRMAFTDPLKGVQIRDLQVVPAISVKPEPQIAIIPHSSTSQQRTWRVTAMNNVPGPAQGTVELKTPAGWAVQPTSAPFRFSRKSESVSLAFTVTIPGGRTSEETKIQAVARLDGREYTSWYQVVSYPHIWTRHLYYPSDSLVKSVDVKIAPGLTVGYIRGTQDEIPDALKQLGVKIEMLDAEDLAFGDLSRFDCIIGGVRAYVSRDDVRTYNQRLLDYVKNGGAYIVQYNTGEWNPGEYAPYPARFVRFGNDRITVEDSAVEILQPDHPVFNRPNQITPADFDGWVQERGLYFWSEWDPRYRPLLSGHDPGEEPKLGGWLEAEYGKGLYVYTAYAWFRQLPAGVPGAFRLFANLISLPKTRVSSK